MDIREQNITIVYKSLGLGDVDRNGLKKAVGEPSMIADMPDIIVVLKPPLIVQIGDRRIRVSLQLQTDSIGQFPIWEVASNCHKLVKNPQLVAYGFNFTLVQPIETSGDPALTNSFLANRSHLEELLSGGQIVSVTPKLRFIYEGIRHELILEQADGDGLAIKINAHYESSRLPNSKILSDQFFQTFAYLTMIAPQLSSLN